MLGILASTAALAIWIAYGLANTAVMRSADAPDGLQWTGIQGIGAAIGSILLLPLASFDLAAKTTASDIFRFVAWALVMGLAGSWLATWCWVTASRCLPLAHSAQLIVSETVLALWPHVRGPTAISCRVDRCFTAVWRCLFGDRSFHQATNNDVDADILTLVGCRGPCPTSCSTSARPSGCCERPLEELHWLFIIQR